MLDQKRNRRPKIQFDLTPEMGRDMDEIQQLSGAATRVEVFRKALLFYGWLIRDVDHSSIIQIIKDGNIITSFPVGLIKGYHDGKSND